METHMEGSAPGTVLLNALIMAARLAPLFVLLGAVLSLVISVAAMRKKLIGLAALFLLIPLTLIVSSCFWFLSFSDGMKYNAATSICDVILGLAMLAPFVVVLMVLSKIGSKPTTNCEEEHHGHGTVCKD